MKKKQIDFFYEWLENYLDYEKSRFFADFSLKTIRHVAQKLNNPQNNFNSVHIAGSKGKGSVATMLASLIEKAGNKTGLYVSPHLFDFSERITHNTVAFDDELYGRAADFFMPRINSLIPSQMPEQKEPTWFELVTLFSFVVFNMASCNWAVFETGLGGRLDATNIIVPKACIITPIELEHTETLGNTIEKIALEKAGIFKPSVPIFVAKQIKKTQNLFEAEAKKMDSNLFFLEDFACISKAEPTIDGLNIEISFNSIPGGPRFSRPLHTKLNMLSIIQAENAALASYAAKYLFPDLTEKDIENALFNAKLPGRFEIFSKSPPIVLDGAHTEKSMKATLDTFKETFSQPCHLLFACAADKNIDAMVHVFLDTFSHITVTRPGDKKASNFVLTVEAFEKTFDNNNDSQISYDYNFKTAIKDAVAKAEKEKAALLVTGSFYLLAEFKTLFYEAK